MKPSQILLVVAFVSLAAITVHANPVPIDPRIIIGHGSDPGGPGSCGLKFRIKLNNQGGGITNCINTSGRDWIGLDIFASIGQGNTVNCMLSAFFSNCTVQVGRIFDHKEEIEIMLSGGEIPNGSPFFINLNKNGSSNPDDNGWFTPNGLTGKPLEGEAVLAPTPEPGTLLLFASGLAVFWLRLRRESSPEIHL